MWVQHRFDSRVCQSSQSGQRARGSVPRNRGKNTTLVASLSLEGIGASMIIEGAVNAAAFETYLEHILVPSLHPGQIVVLDNLRVHKGARVRQLIEDKGCQVLFLPAYSPDLSPIEETFSKIYVDWKRRLGGGYVKLLSPLRNLQLAARLWVLGRQRIVSRIPTVLTHGKIVLWLNRCLMRKSYQPLWKSTLKRGWKEVRL